MREHEPVKTPVTVLPLLPAVVHIKGVLLAKLTARPEDAVAIAVDTPPTVRPVERVIEPIVWLLWSTAMFCVT